MPFTAFELNTRTAAGGAAASWGVPHPELAIANPIAMNDESFIRTTLASGFTRTTARAPAAHLGNWFPHGNRDDIGSPCRPRQSERSHRGRGAAGSDGHVRQILHGSERQDAVRWRVRSALSEPEHEPSTENSELRTVWFRRVASPPGMEDISTLVGAARRRA